MDAPRELVERVRRGFEKVSGTDEKRMFGRAAFLLSGTLRMGVGSGGDHVLLVRVRREEAAALLTEPGVGPAIMRGRPMRGWVFLQPEAVATDAQLERWIALSLDAV